MPEWLTQSATTTTVHPEVLAVRLGLSLVFGIVVAGIYRISHGKRHADAGVLTTTLVLLCILTAMVSVVIGDSVARAFGLVGALSIVRFRAVVDDTRDTAFVICAVIVGMAVGAGLVLLPVMGLPVIGATAWVLERFGQKKAGETLPESNLIVRRGLRQVPDDVIAAILNRHATQIRTIAAATARQGAAIDVTYRVKLHSDAALTELVSELNQIEGVQSVELTRA